MTLGVVLLLFWILRRGLDSASREPSPVLTFFQRYSRFSLTVYIIHHAVHVWPLYLAAWIQGHRTPWYYYADAVSTPVALLLSLVFVVAFYGVILLWEKWGNKYSFEWMLAKLTG